MTGSNRSAFTLNFAAVAMAIGILTTGSANAQTTITGTTSNAGGHDTWNVAGNCDVGIPTGADSAVVGTGVLRRT